MKLRDSRFSHSQRGAHFFHREFLEIIKRDHLAFLFLENLHSFGEKRSKLALQALEKRVLSRTVWLIDADFFILELIVGLRSASCRGSARAIPLIVSETRAPSFPMRSAKSDSEGDRAEMRRERAKCFFHLPSLFSQAARAPIDGAKAIQNCAANAEFCVRLQLYLFRVVELFNRIDQSDYARVDKIFERHLYGQTIMNAASDIVDLGKILREESFARRRIETVLDVRWSCVRGHA